MQRVPDDAVRLLAALRKAGCHCFIDAEDGQFYCSPPAQRVDWDGDVEAAIEEHYEDLLEIVDAERLQVH